MSFSPMTTSSKLSERLTTHKIRELAALIVKSEYPETSNAAVKPLLEMLVGGPFDIKDNFLIKEPAVVLLLLELLPKLSDQLQLEIWRTLGDILSQSLSNIHACRHLHLIERCLEHLRKTSNGRVAGHIARVVEIVGGYSISLKELRDILSYLYTGQMKTWAPHSIPLIGALNSMAINTQPDVFFTFSGTPGAAITLPPISKWPTQSGFSFNVWIRLEKPHYSQRDYYKPVVYWFRTSRPELGYSSHFIGNTLILETVGKGHKRPQTHAVDFMFQCYRWYMLTVVYVHNRIKSSALSCCVDGKLVLSADVSLPSTVDVYDKCFLGTSPSATEDVVFQGQMSAVYLFREPLKQDTIVALHKLGPSYKSQFKFDAESDVPLAPQQKKLLFDGHLSNVVSFSYNAKSVDGQLCLEASPNENQSLFSHSPHATLLEGVEPVVTTPFHNILHSLGGAQALFPLFSQLDLPQTTTDMIDHSLSVKVLRVIFELARNSTSFMLQLVQMNAIKLLSFLLGKVSSQHLTKDLVTCSFEFARYLMVAPSGKDLLSQLIDHLLFSAGLWIRASKKVQVYLYSLLATEFSTRPLGKTGLLLQELVTVPQLMFILKEYYSLVSAGDREIEESHAEVRPYILLLVKEFVLKGKSTQSENMQSILDYLCYVPHEDDLHDVLSLVLALVFEDKQDNMVRVFHQCNGLNTAAKLLACVSEKLTLHALKLIGKVLHHTSPKQQTSLIESLGLFAVIREKLLSAGQPVTMAMFNTLFEVLVNCPSRKIIDSHYIALDLSQQIWFPAMLAVTIELVCSLHTTYYDWEESDVQLRMQLFSYMSSLCAQEHRNCKAILKVRHWQHWLLMLADQPGASETDHSSLQEMLYQFFHTMLLYCFQEEQDGWRVWVETTAAIHAYSASKLEATSELSDSLTASSFTELHSSSVNSFTDKTEEEQTLQSEDQPLHTSSSTDKVQEPTVPVVVESVDDSTEESDKDLRISDVESVLQKEKDSEPVPEPKSEQPSEPASSTPPVQHRTISPLALSTNALSGSNAPSSLTRTISPVTKDLSRPSSAKMFSISGQPSPISLSASPAPLSLSRTSSTETPQSPFLIPRNPFLNLVGKMPKFQWDTVHFNLLESLFKSLHAIVSKWTSSSQKSKAVGDDRNKFLRSNISQLLALTVDNIIDLNGGLKHLQVLASQYPVLDETSKVHRSDSLNSSQAPSLRAAITADSSNVETLLHLSLELSEVFVLSGLLKLSPIELRMRMEHGGAVKQGLRLVIAAADLSTFKTNLEYKEFHEHFYRQKQAATLLHRDSTALLKTIGLSQSSIEKYFESCKAKKIAVIRTCQCLLSEKFLTLFSGSIPKDGEGKLLIQQMVTSVFYYLAMLCVSKYQNVLSAIKREEKQEAMQSKPNISKQPSRQSIAPNTKTVSIHMTGPPESLQTEITEIHVSDREESPEIDTHLNSEQSPIPPSLSLHARALDISEQIEASMSVIGPFLCQLLVEHRSSLIKVLVGANGRPLLTDAVMRLAENSRVVELTMLLCSQDWQASLHKAGGKLFSELLTEGRRVSQFSETYIRSVASKATSDLDQTLSSQTQKFTDFEEQLSLFLTDTIKRFNKEAQLRKAEVFRHIVSAKELWRKISSVVDENGSFDITPLRNSKFWRLDLRENNLRQRLQLLANPNGSEHESARRVYETSSIPEGSTVPKEDVPLSALTPTTPRGMLPSEEFSLGSDEMTDSLTALELSLSDQDQTAQLLSVSCLMVVLAHSLPGTLVFTKRSMTFTADDSSEEYKKASYLIDYCDLNGEWLLPNVTAVFSRRYLHQNKAIEIFLSDRSSAFFVFESNKDLKTVIRKLPKVGVGNEYDLPQTRPMSLASPQQLFKKCSMTTRWVKREISNFEYLVYLNTIAGRSYNDLNQYPVFPWILTDYSSEKLNLTDETIYRDLSKPIGALNEARFRQFEERYNGFEDDSLPPFHYGTHYSTMAFVLHWLLRVEPFSSMHISFHDGLFDHSARLFYSLSEAWTNSNRDSSNVNELIPEFFYLPEMFLNENKYDLGREGSYGEGPTVSDVKLPPWADSPHEFVRINREALESEYVSSNLHHWIDLIFGYKQRGEEAVKAKNVFYYLTYNGAVDLDTIDDPKLKRGLEEQIRQFGQTPAQLLKEPHPVRQPLAKGFPPQPVQGLNPRDPAMVAELQVTPDVPIALVQLCSPPLSNVLVISSNQLFAVNKWTVSQASSGHPVTVSLEPDPNIISGLRTRLGDPLDQSVSASSACFATPPDCEVIFVSGFWDNSFKCFATESGKMVQSVFGHMGIVTCVDFAPDGGLHGIHGDGLIGTGSHDATVLLWQWSGRLNRVVGIVSDNQAPLAPVAVLTGHEQSVACVSLCSSLGLVVSAASKYGYCLVHTTSGELLHKVTPSAQWMHPHLVRLTANGHFVVHYADQKGCLAAFTCNGKQLCQHTLDEPTLALAVTKDGRYIITGGFDCRVKVFYLHNMQLKYAHERFDSSIRSLYISEDQKFIFAGLASGSIAVLTTHFWMQ